MELAATGLVSAGEPESEATMDGDQPSLQRKNWVSLVLYVLAFLVLAGGVLLGLTLTNAASLVPAASSGFQSALVKPLWDTWQAGVRLFGLVEIGISMLISGLLVACGLLWARLTELAARVETLELSCPAADVATPGQPIEALPGVYQHPNVNSLERS